jgi:hypothetical protein
MDNKSLEARVKELEKDVAKLKDIEDIQRLQKTYGYYLEHWMYEDIVELFADDPATELNLTAGIYKGKEGAKRYFTGMNEMTQLPDFIHQIMQLAGVVDVATDAKTARGRWWGFGVVVMPRRNGYFQEMAGGIYTCDYLKEKGVWKLWKLMWNPTFDAAGFTVTKDKPSVAIGGRENSLVTNPGKVDIPRTFNTRYPSGYIVPFHYNNPVTGKPSSAEKRNAARSKKQK